MVVLGIIKNKFYLILTGVLAVLPVVTSALPSSPCVRKLCIVGANAENLFDPTDRWWSRDWLVPGWNQALVDERAKKLARLISQDGQVYADLHVLSEVESITALNSVIFALNDLYGMRYRAAFLAGGRDERGIQVAMLVKTEGILGSPVEEIHHYPYGDYNQTNGTRNMIELVFDIHAGSAEGSDAKSPVILEQAHLFGVHLPSLRNPTDARIGATQKLKQRLNKILASNPRAKIMIIGDFNTIPGDFNDRGVHPIDDVLLKPEPGSPLAHNPLIDVYSLLSEEQRSQMPPGTYFYRRDGSWSRLDRMLATRSLIETRSGIQIDPLSLTHYAPDFATEEYVARDGTRIRIPHSWQLKDDNDDLIPMMSQEGITDHHPIVIRGSLH